MGEFDDAWSVCTLVVGWGEERASCSLPLLDDGGSLHVDLDYADCSGYRRGCVAFTLPCLNSVLIRTLGSRLADLPLCPRLRRVAGQFLRPLSGCEKCFADPSR